MTLVEMLRAFGADEALIALAERWCARSADGTYPDGTDPLTPDDMNEMLSGLVALGAEGHVNANDEEPGNGLIMAAADAAQGLRTEIETADAEAAAAETERQANMARLRGEAAEDETPPAGDGEGEGGAGGDGDEGGEGGETPPGGGDGGEGAEAPPAGEGEPVLAGAGARSMRANLAEVTRRRPRQAEPAPDEDSRARAMISFGADIPNQASGRQVAADRAGLDQVSEAMQRRAESFLRGRGGARGVEEYLTVATIDAVYPEDRRLVDAQGMLLSGSQLTRVVGAVLAREATPQAITAAGGLCAPLQPYYGVEVIGDTDRPVRDEALVGFQAVRGGIISMAPPILPQLLGSIGVWTLDDDVEAASDPEHTKAIIDVDCGALRTSRIRAITARLRYGNILSRTYGEWTQAWADLQVVAQARVAETELLADIKAGSKVVNRVTTEVSAVIDTLNTLNRVTAGMRSRHRAWEMPFRVILPEIWLVIAAEDWSKRIPGGGNPDDNLILALERINRWFQSRNLNVTFSPDMSLIGPQAAATDLADLPPTVDFAVYPEGTWLHLDAGTLDLGVVRDTTTNAVNNFETFSETFEGAHLLGVESIWGSLNVCPSGAVNGTLDPTGRCASYT